MRDFKIIAITPPGLVDPAVAIAASRAGAIGVLDLQYSNDERAAMAALRKLAQYSRRDCGVMIDSGSPQFVDNITANLPEPIRIVILTASSPEHLSSQVALLHTRRLQVLLQTISFQEAQLGIQLGVDALIAKGHESGGRVGEETTFILLQRLLARTSLPIWAQGGIGLHSASACYAAGAAGVVLDSQLTLTRECSLPVETKSAIAHMDGSETVCIGGQLGESIRLYSRPGLPALAELQQVAQELCEDARPGSDVRRQWGNQVRMRVGWQNHGRHVWLLGQEAAFAAPLAERFRTVGGVIEGLRAGVDAHVRSAQALQPLAEEAPLARSHGTRYPIVQGPMTRVSDGPSFARQVAEAGALPFLALALMRARQVEPLLEETRQALGSRPWGVGILGFVPPDLRQEQMQVIRSHPPSFALIAGGRPDQALSLERAHIPTYLHVPSPGLLQLFLENGARRFVFEGRECGGHVGPRTSFVLWNMMIDTLLERLPAGDLANYHVLFAGGIHDAVSASMVATMGAPLAERGVRIGVLLGTAYLFTQEAVASGAIVEGFQREALACVQTVLLDSGPGHATRCAATPFTDMFHQEKQRLSAQSLPVEEIRAALEELNLGRLRIASKGFQRDPDYRRDPHASRFTTLTDAEQRREGMYMIGQAAVLRDSICTLADLHRQVSVEGSARLAHLPAPVLSRATNSRSERPCNIAIVGMSCLLPKAPDLQTYWQNILAKVDAITEVPVERWDWRRYYDPDPNAPDKVYSRWGGFLDDIPFDPMRYGIPPNTLSSIEPLQLLTLEAVRAALEDAGYAERSFPRRSTAVILGVGGGSADLGQQYAVRSALPSLIPDVSSDVLARLAAWTEDSFPGILLNVVAGRVANRFDLGGVNYTVDAACASSLAAVYLATRELEAGTSDMVIVGGADTIQNPFAYLCFSKTLALSPRGRCSPFDAEADGIAISEGVAILILKRLEDAERDGDRIYAVIKGVAGSSDGRDKGLTAPRPEGQALALQRAYAQAGFSPATLGLVEAHGTGTVAGDQAEVETLKQVFGAAAAANQSCAIGSVKSMIGHTKSTAGVAGMAKAALALYHNVLPPTLHVEEPNPKARFAESPFYVNTEPRPWLKTTAGHARRAGVSAFGFGGTNFHAVLEEYAGNVASPPAAAEAWSSELLLWSGRSREELIGAIDQVEQALARGAKPHLRDLAFTLWQSARESETLRLAFVATSLDDLAQKLARTRAALGTPGAYQIHDSRGIYYSEQRLASEGRLAFLFPGQGSQHLNMLGELAIYFSELRESFELADRVLADRFPRRLSSYIFPPRPSSPEQERSLQEALTRTNIAQPALGAASMGLMRLLSGLGVEPGLVAGHSYGEYVALCAAGVLDEEQLYDLSEARGRCIVESAGEELGAMAAVSAERDHLTETLSAMEGVWIANANSPQQTIISGTRQGVSEAIELLNQRGVGTRRLPVACAFHSPIMAPARDRLASLLADVDFHAPQIEVFSNISASPYPPDRQGIAATLAEHLISPVQFVDQVEAMYHAGARLFVEVGPRNVLAGLVDQILGNHPHLATAVDGPGHGGLFQLHCMLGQLAAQGLVVNLDRLYAGRTVRQLNLNALEEETRVQPLPPTTWLVNGGRAKPLRETQAQAQPPSTPLSPPAAVTARGNGHAQSMPLPPAAGDAGGDGSAMAPLPHPADEGAANVMLQFQQLMNQFLETQQQVMLAYLRGSADGAIATSERRLPSAIPQNMAIQTGPFSDSPVGAEPPPNGRTPETPNALPAAPITDREWITGRLLELLSERTGYPAETLNADLNLEADLGIDSIKRVEILGAFQRACPTDQQPKVQAAMDKLSGLKTLRAISEAAAAILAGEHSVEPEAPRLKPSGSPDEQDGQVPRFLLELVEAPRPTPVHDLSATDLFILTDDERGVAHSLAKSIRQSGAGAVVVRQGEECREGSEASYTANLLEATGVGEFLKIVRARYTRPITGLVHLLPLRTGVAFTNMSVADERGRSTLEIKSLFHLAQALASDLKQGTAGKGRLLAASAMGGHFAMASAMDAFFPGHGAVAGLLKTLGEEWTGVRCRIVDLDAGQSPPILADQLLAELVTVDERREIGYQGSRRVTLQPVFSPLTQDRQADSGLDSNSVVLITGGGRGITAEIACELAERNHPTLLLVGRTPLPASEETSETAGLESPQDLKRALMDRAQREGQPFAPARIEAAYSRVLRERELRRNLVALRSAGASVHYYALDVRETVAFERLIDGIYETFGHIDAVIHGAGLIEDKLIEDKSWESFERVLDTKASSAFTLSRRLRPHSLRWLVFFSSVAGRWGNRGQSDYAAANDLLNKLSLELDRAWPGRVVSINWGPWERRGMVSAEVQKQFAVRGLAPIRADDGRRAFYEEICFGEKGQVEVILGGGNWGRGH